VRVVHLTDPHLAAPPSWRALAGRSHWGKRYLGYLSWRRRRRHLMRREWLAEAETEVAARAPDLRLLSGDLAQIGTKEEILAVRSWLEAFARPEGLVLVPGNHDVYAPDSVALVEDAWSDYLPEGGLDGFPIVRRRDDVVVFGLTTAVPTEPLSAAGEIGAAQLDRLEAALAAHPDAFRVLLLHHPPLPRMIQYRKRLRDAAALAEVLGRQPVHLVLYGHQHRNLRSEYLGARVYCTAPASAENASFRCFDVARAGSSWRVDAACIERRAGSFVEAEREAWTVNAPG
jgi:3',5'-cyclic AMP phosphodiesterase CpdA